MSFSFTEAQQYHVFTLQPLSNGLQMTSNLSSGANLTSQQQQYIHQQQELKGIQKT